MNVRVIGFASLIAAAAALSACGGTSSVPVAPVLNATPTPVPVPTATATATATASPTATPTVAASPTATST
jgi:hypothetical protein